ncbi:MAG: transglycosylase SLT domain-containing protein [Nitrospirae bacterium]|nr:transglycosylase SLT domain-containing protein [Nitrospirota bacterium]
MKLTRCIITLMIFLLVSIWPVSGNALLYPVDKTQGPETTDSHLQQQVPHKPGDEQGALSMGKASTPPDYSILVSPLQKQGEGENSLIGLDYFSLDGGTPQDGKDGVSDGTGVADNKPSFSQSGTEDTTGKKFNGRARAAIESYLTFFSETVKNRFSRWLAHGSRYMPLMKKILAEHDLPGDLVYLSLIESGFNLFARSPAQAVGPWQLMIGTARHFNLKVNYWVDERRDPVKSTRAASTYLRFLIDKFGSWDLALAAYNAGEGTIENALRRSNVSTYWNLLNIPHETRDFVPKFIAAREIAREPEKFGIDDIDYNQPIDYDVVEIEPPATLKFIAKAADTTIEKIKELNPELKQWCIPPDVHKYRIRIPAGKKDSFLEAYNSASPSNRQETRTYKVRKGDTIRKIAAKTGVSAETLCSLNNLTPSKRVPKGTVLQLPVTMTSAGKSSPSSSSEDSVISHKSSRKNARESTAGSAEDNSGTSVDAAKNERAAVATNEQAAKETAVDTSNDEQNDSNVVKSGSIHRKHIRTCSHAGSTCAKCTHSSAHLVKSSHSVGKGKHSGTARVSKVVKTRSASSHTPATSSRKLTASSHKLNKPHTSSHEGRLHEKNSGVKVSRHLSKHKSRA